MINYKFQNSKRIKRLSPALFFIFTSLFFLLPPAVSAQTTLPLTVSPARQTIYLDPGQAEKTTVSFLNQAAIPIAGNIKVVDFIVKDNTGTPYLLDNEAIPSKYSAAAWIKPNVNKAVIAAGNIFKVQLEIKAPENAAPGGRYAAIYFEPTGTLPETKEFITQKEGVQSVSPRLAALIYLRVNGPITEAALVKELTVPGFVEYGPVSVKAEVVNNGSYHITPKGQITLTNWQGKVVDQYVLDEKNIFPERSRIYETKLGKQFLFGRYAVNLLAIYGDANQTLSVTKTFWAFPVRLALAIILAITIIVLLIVFITKKVKSRQMQLETQLEKEIDEIEKLKEKFKDKE